MTANAGGYNRLVDTTLLGTIGNIDKRYYEIIGKKDSINLTAQIQNLGFLTENGWAQISTGNTHIIIPCRAGDKFELNANNTNGTYSFFKSYSLPVGSQTPDYCSGIGKIDIPANTTITVTAPFDAQYLYITYEVNGNVRIGNVYSVIIGKLAEKVSVNDFNEFKDYVGERTDIDFTSLNKINGFIARNTWQVASGIGASFQFVLIPVDLLQGKMCYMEQVLSDYSAYAFLKSDERSQGATPDFCDGTSSSTNLLGNVNVIVPNDANFLYICVTKNWTNVTPRVYFIDNNSILYQVDQNKKQGDKNESSIEVLEQEYDPHGEASLRQMTNVIQGFGISSFEEKAVPIKVPSIDDGNYKYNAWPFITTFKDRLVCLYTRALNHEGGGNRYIYMQYSFDGIAWSKEYKVIDNVNPLGGVTAIGNDSNGNILAWVRNVGFGNTHELYRSTDGYNFEKIANGPATSEYTIEGFTSIINVPTVGLMSFFCTYYLQNQQPSRWGIATSSDDGLTWTLQLKWQETDAFKCPMETNGVYLGDGKILAMARRDVPGSPYVLHHIQSSDYGQTWTLADSNVDDILSSTPSLLFDSTTQKVTVFYVKRGNYNNILKVREADLSVVWDNPTSWPASTDINTMETYDGGNVNAKAFNGYKFAVVYAGSQTEDGIYITMIQ
jgi:hypothetical protein